MAEIVEISSPPSSLESCDLMTPEQLRTDLDECLTNIQSHGSFALFEHLSNPPNPGLYLRKGGLIGLPLSERDAKVLVEASHAAPFGKGEQTIVDSSVRKTWELSPGDFEIRNPAWQTFLKTIVAKVSAGLGVDSTGKGVSAELYKMLLYDEGAMFKPHQDSEKAPRMFATLVIALPSKHEGGEVRVTHSGNTKTFETSRFSEFDSSYLAWFADVTHEVKPVLAGHRLVLTYNLIHTTLDCKELSANSDVSMSNLRLILSKWRNDLEKDIDLPTELAFLLQHKYTKASLCYDGLKGHDQQVAAHLREACQEHGFYFYLANLKRTVAGGCEDYGGYGYRGGFHEIIDEFDSHTILKDVVELDGTEVEKDLSFDEELFIQADPFENEEPDEEEYSGFTGNEGVSATHFYHRTVALILPKTRRMEFFLGARIKQRPYHFYGSQKEIENPKVIQWIDRLSAKLGDDSTDNASREDLHQICKMVIRQSKEWKTTPVPVHYRQRRAALFSDEVVARVISLCVELDSETMFLDAFDLYSKEVATSTFQSVGVALLRYGLKSLLPKLSAILSNVSALSGRLEILDQIRAGLEEESKRNSQSKIEYQTWIKAEINLALSPAVAMKFEKDGISLVKISREISSQEIFNAVLPAVKRNMNNTTMVMAFLTGLFDSGLAGKIPADVARTIYHDLISDLADSFSLCSAGGELAESNKRVVIPSYIMGSRVAAPTPIPDLRNSHNVAVLLSQCQQLELKAELEQVVNKLINEAKSAELDLFEILYLPFLKLLATLLTQKNIVVKNSPFQILFQQILGQYIMRWVQPRPTPPKDWKQAMVSCRCQDCQCLNRFLVNPNEKVGRFPVNKQRRGHLHKMLGNTGCTHETERYGSPQTLVVTKTQAKYQAGYKAWELRCGVAKTHLAEFGTETLKDLLAEMHGPILSLSTAQLSSIGKTAQDSIETFALTSNGNTSNRVLPPVTKRKTPSDFICH